MSVLQTMSGDSGRGGRVGGGVDGDCEVRDGQPLGTAAVLDGHDQAERPAVDGVETASDRDGAGTLIHGEQTLLVAVCDHVRQLAVCSCSSTVFIGLLRDKHVLAGGVV